MTSVAFAVELGGLAYLADPNEPGITSEAIAGGWVYRIDDETDRARTIKLWRGQLYWNEIDLEKVVVAYPAAEARQTAGEVYHALCKQIGKERKKQSHVGLLQIALLAAKVYAGEQ